MANTAIEDVINTLEVGDEVSYMNEIYTIQSYDTEDITLQDIDGDELIITWGELVEDIELSQDDNQ